MDAGRGYRGSEIRHVNRARIAGVAMAILWALCAGGAHAAGDAKSGDAKATARASFELGMKRYNLGQYKEAQQAFEDAYLAKPDPVFLFNVGQCHRMLGEYEKAVNSYRAYLRQAPNAPNQEAVEHLIDEANKEIDRMRAEKARSLPPQDVKPPAEERPAPPPPPAVEARPEPPAPTPIYKKWWLWAAVGGGVAVVALGAGLGVGLSGGASDPAIPSTTAGNYSVNFQ